MTRCYLIRHAQTQWNMENRLQGYSDIPLSSLGLFQARQLGMWFAKRPLQGIFTSVLQRSRQTAQAILQSHEQEVSVVADEELKEMGLGDWEGLTPEEIDARFDGGYQRWKQRSSIPIPGAESTEVFRSRVRRAMERIRSSLGQGEYAVVSHGGVIAAWLADCLKADYDVLIRQLRLDNASVTAFEWRKSGSPCVLWINASVSVEDAIPVPSLQEAI
ncbi:MAG: histidine phosphatase family protein [Candidatus Omnitrophica bacterium]|nr:histidine phosphatase family protein [Candidatus Omnitrophota bacterium]MBI3010789.1 histidine phosphatase family protein [Candidatus Omnitrophota bacterium]